ncbi:hypothetical protein BKH13_01045 [Actinomyces naeslundii]|uniref:PH domain-containing protein n=3 Tax=Actinomyces naeslundii TaxID=1655 RepID=A0ABX3F263_ACTNA|nr:hypothetical protein BKH11_12725 [Actinomyces naeslundii]OLO83390.1 hypothetical protein BKH12_08240 [Actinomyces naeslundii]OLO86273.1 hypothetical protein BKH13_01045 [Actinomyces naeslundii]OLO90830.1 hypothetical protein BKH09_09285 [Actinomyces naeslundii]OLO91920.1 hypothetical protein BKH10_00325 [Actinomyces naeslundii]
MMSFTSRSGGSGNASGGSRSRRPVRSKSLRGWTTETSDGRLILRRSVPVRYAAMAAAVVGVSWMALTGAQVLGSLVNGFDRSDDMIILVMLGIPTIWGINVTRRRTVLSESGVEMRRLLFTERRPWTSVLSRFTLSTLNMTAPGYEGGIDRTRIVLVNGDRDDLIRLPGCVLGMTLDDSSNRGSAALQAMLNYVRRHGWIVSDAESVHEDPRLVEARQNHGADKMTRKSRLMFCTPVWRRVKEHLCNGGLFLIGLGVLFILISVQQLFYETASVSDSDRLYAVLFLVLAPVLMVYPLYKIYGCFQRVVVDDRGIRAGRRSCAWPESRSGLFVAGDRIFIVCANGRHFALDGAGVTWGSFRQRQEQLIARCEAIWLWGVAHGATRETGRYIPIPDTDMQKEREILERGIGLAVPRRGQPA